jgi:TIR domain/Trypsin-like peptidase domain/Effector-associated domain 9
MSYFQAFKSSIVRIFSGQTVIGAGFLISDRHLLTCAHVVTAALKLPSNTLDLPPGIIEFDFPLLAPGQRVTARVVFWQPVNPGQVGEDIAVLKVSPALLLPSEARSIRLVTAEEPWGHPFRIFGFPKNRDDGIWASGVLREHQAVQWVQMEDIKAQGYSVEPGFSGAPVWDETLDGVVGMAVAADLDREEARVAFMIPTTALGQAWNGLASVIQAPPASSAVSSTQQVEVGEGTRMIDFFISYNKADKQWAEWIAWTLEEAGYSVVIQAWDFRPGGNFVLDMQRAAAESKRTIAVLSESYLKSSFTQPEWAAAFASDPESLERKLLPVRVKECKPEGMLRPLVYVDLVELSSVDAKKALLDSLAQRAKPDHPPAFPGMEGSVPETITVSERVIETPKNFPSALSRVQKVKEAALLQQLDNLIADYGAANQQLGHTDNAGRPRLERQLAAIAQDMDKVAADLDALGA